MHTKKSIENFETMCDLLEDRLNTLGEIRTDDAWKLCGSHFGYNTIAYSFKRIMGLMVEVGKAYQVRNGLWVITKPNTKAKAPAPFMINEFSAVKLDLITKTIE